MAGKTNHAKDKAGRLDEKLKGVRKRYNKLKKSMEKGKAGDAETSFRRAQNNYEQAKKLCARLKKEGEDVPSEGDKDFAAPGAFKPPGYRAAKDRDLAKKDFDKRKAVWEKASAPNASKQERLDELKEKIKEIQQQQEQAEEEIKAAKKAKRKGQ